jgi:hypothetical protein
MTKEEKELLDLCFYVGIKNIANSLQLENAAVISEKIKACKELHLKLSKDYVSSTSESK